MRRTGIGGLRQAKRVIVAVVGFTVLLIGVAMLFLPGPAIVIIPAGLAILAGEFAWARRLLARAMAGLRSMTSGFKNRGGQEK